MSRLTLGMRETMVTTTQGLMGYRQGGLVGCMDGQTRCGVCMLVWLEKPDPHTKVRVI